jgi:Tfp pilus assembly protein PilF
MNALIRALAALLFAAGAAHATQHDFFTAHENPATANYLALVEEAHVNLVAKSLRARNFVAARGDIEYALERFPNHPKGLVLATHFARLTNDPTFAISYFVKALALYPQYAVTHSEYGAYLVSIGMLEEGIARLGKAAGMDPELLQAWVGLAQAYTKAGNAEAARRANEKARALRQPAPPDRP